MLIPAQLYREELKRMTTECWVKPKYKYYFAGEFYELQIGDNWQYRRSYACVNSNNELIGYFSYNFNEHDARMRDFGLVSFIDNINSILIRDVCTHVKDMLTGGKAVSLELWAFTDNPACNLYNRYMEKHGGKKLCELTNSAFFDGHFHNTAIYELQASDFIE